MFAWPQPGGDDAHPPHPFIVEGSSIPNPISKAGSAGDKDEIGGEDKDEDGDGDFNLALRTNPTGSQHTISTGSSASSSSTSKKSTLAKFGGFNWCLKARGMGKKS